MALRGKMTAPQYFRNVHISKTIPNGSGGRTEAQSFHASSTSSSSSFGHVSKKARSAGQGKHVASNSKAEKIEKGQSHQSELSSDTAKKEKMTLAELDEELRLKLEGLSGEGGASGVEYENGKAEGLKRGVKDNMFRYI